MLEPLTPYPTVTHLSYCDWDYPTTILTLNPNQLPNTHSSQAGVTLHTINVSFDALKWVTESETGGLLI